MLYGQASSPVSVAILAFGLDSIVRQLLAKGGGDHVLIGGDVENGVEVFVIIAVMLEAHPTPESRAQTWYVAWEIADGTFPLAGIKMLGVAIRWRVLQPHGWQ